LASGGYQADGDRDIGGADGESIDEIFHVGEEPAGADTDEHGEKYPEGEVAIKE
jgi:hypothetical protein